MITGVEIAGLALAVAPLIISAIEDYREGLEPFKIWARYRRELGLLRNVLDVEIAKLLDTCEQLLQPVVPQAQLHELITNPGGPHWQNPVLQDKLKELLARSYSSFMSALGEIKDALDELHGKLDFAAVDGKVYPTFATSYTIASSFEIAQVQRQERLGERLGSFKVLSFEREAPQVEESSEELERDASHLDVLLDFACT
jgi:hypothetical protein